jgi:hypothetical protein
VEPTRRHGRDHATVEFPTCAYPETGPPAVKAIASLLLFTLVSLVIVLVVVTVGVEIVLLAARLGAFVAVLAAVLVIAAVALGTIVVALAVASRRAREER